MSDSFSQHYDAMLDSYSQTRYDLDPNALSDREIDELKTLAKEKRIDYGISPIGVQIFRYIYEKENNLFFEHEKFENKELDAILYMPNASNDNVFIILNGNQSLLNQIFATAHEYYHYLKDVEYLRANPHVCYLSHMEQKDEQKASRFAAEFLLPDEALIQTVRRWLKYLNKKYDKDLDFSEVASVCYHLTAGFGLPLKTVLYRLNEEGYIPDISHYLHNYEFIKTSFKNIQTQYTKQMHELMSTENEHVVEYMYDFAVTAYKNGYVSLDKLENEMELLKLDKSIVFQELNHDIDEEDEEDDLNEEIKRTLRSRMLRQE